MDPDVRNISKESVVGNIIYSVLNICVKVFSKMVFLVLTCLSLFAGSQAVITKVAEVFVGFLAQQSVRSAALRGSRSVKASDVFQTIHSNEIFSFLRMDFPRKLLNITTVNSTLPTKGSLLHILNWSSKCFFR